MYEFVDQPVSAMAAPHRLFLDAIRVWALACATKHDPRDAVAGRHPALPCGWVQEVHRLLTTIDGGGRTPIAMSCPCAPTVNEFEAVLLGVWKLAAAGRMDASIETLSGLVLPAPAEQAAAIMRRLSLVTLDR